MILHDMPFIQTCLVCCYY